MIGTEPFDAGDYLETPASQAALLNDAFTSGDAGYITHVLGIVARARGVTEAGKEALYKSLSETDNPNLTIFFGVMRALGMTLSVAPAGAPPLSVAPAVVEG